MVAVVNRVCGIATSGIMTTAVEWVKEESKEGWEKAKKKVEDEYVKRVPGSVRTALVTGKVDQEQVLKDVTELARNEERRINNPRPPMKPLESSSEFRPDQGAKLADKAINSAVKNVAGKAADEATEILNNVAGFSKGNGPIKFFVESDGLVGNGRLHTLVGLKLDIDMCMEGETFSDRSKTSFWIGKEFAWDFSFNGETFSRNGLGIGHNIWRSNNNNNMSVQANLEVYDSDLGTEAQLTLMGTVNF